MPRRIGHLGNILIGHLPYLLPSLVPGPPTLPVKSVPRSAVVAAGTDSVRTNPGQSETVAKLYARSSRAMQAAIRSETVLVAQYATPLLSL